MTGGRRLGPAALLLAVVACGDGTTEPPERSYSIEIVSGDGQRGVAGWTLTEPLVVRVTDGEGVAAQSVSITFTASNGGTVAATGLTDAFGLARSTWALGVSAVTAQQATATVAGTSTSVAFSGRLLGPDEVDVVLVDGALGPLTGMVGFIEDSGLEILGTSRTTETALHVPPDLPVDTRIVVFGSANRPLYHSVARTSGVDTTTVVMLPPVPVDIDFHVRTGNFEAQRAIMQTQLARTDEVWAGEGVGVVLGSVEFIDDTDPPRRVEMSSSGICSGLTLRDAVQIDVVTSIDGGQFTGWGCWAGQIYLGDGTDRFPYLLAHELGHTFTLVHTQSGMMLPNPPGTTVREGEIFRAHFHTSSVLNTIFDGQPSALRRTCGGSASRCLPEDLDLGRTLVTLQADAIDPLHEADIRPVDGVGRGHDHPR